jgi:type II secretory ATPase GspE/PulE/Tfp pilus assembly ATPase PilB-like protein
VSLEDPIETAVAGVAQSQVHEPSGFTMSSGLRSLLRQDPQVIFVGEIRDRETATMACQAALTGQLVITTFHAGSATEAISRLSDMGIEPYVLRSSILGVLGQRLVRKLCDCKRPVGPDSDRMELPEHRSYQAGGCAACHHTGYRGRLLLAEMLLPRHMQLGPQLLARSDAAELESLAVSGGMRTRWDRARQALVGGLTTAAEIRRVLGQLPPSGTRPHHEPSSHEP